MSFLKSQVVFIRSWIEFHFAYLYAASVMLTHKKGVSSTGHVDFKIDGDSRALYVRRPPWPSFVLVQSCKQRHIFLFWYPCFPRAWASSVALY
jgi:hypothetical protein